MTTTKAQAITTLKATDIYSGKPENIKATSLPEDVELLMPMAWIWPNTEGQVRSGNINLLKVQEMAAAIRANGGKHEFPAIEVVFRPKDGKPYRVNDGEHRWRSVTETNGEMIRAKILPADMDETELLLRGFRANNLRAEMSELDEARLIDRLVNEHGYSVEGDNGEIIPDCDRIVEAMGWDKRQKFAVIWRLKLLNLSAEAQDALINGAIVYDKAGQPEIDMETGRPVRIKLGPERARQLAEMVDPETGEPNHDEQNKVLKRFGKGEIKSVADFKAAKNAFLTPTPKQDVLDITTARSASSQKLLDDFGKKVHKMASAIAEIRQELESNEALLAAISPEEARLLSDLLSQSKTHCDQADKKLSIRKVASNAPKAVRKRTAQSA